MAAGESREEIEVKLGRAARHLAEKRLLKPGDVLSQRIPEQDYFVSLDLPFPQETPLFRWTSLSDGPADLHHRIYAARPDVGAIAAGSFPWAGALARLHTSLPAVFDEQVRHLGVAVQRLPMRSVDEGQIAALSTGANAYMLDDVSLCLGMELERLLPNIEILEKCAESFVLAYCTSQQVRRIPWLVKFIANRRLKKDQTDAAARHLRGERAIMKAGY